MIKKSQGLSTWGKSSFDIIHRIEKDKVKFGITHIYTVVLRLDLFENRFLLVLKDFAFHALDDSLGEELVGKGFNESARRRKVIKNLITHL